MLQVLSSQVSNDWRERLMHDSEAHREIYACSVNEMAGWKCCRKVWVQADAMGVEERHAKDPCHSKIRY